MTASNEALFFQWFLFALLGIGVLAFVAGYYDQFGTWISDAFFFIYDRVCTFKENHPHRVHRRRKRKVKRAIRTKTSRCPLTDRFRWFRTREDTLDAVAETVAAGEDMLEEIRRKAARKSRR